MRRLVEEVEVAMGWKGQEKGGGGGREGGGEWVKGGGEEEEKAGGKVGRWIFALLFLNSAEPGGISSIPSKPK